MLRQLRGVSGEYLLVSVKYLNVYSYPLDGNRRPLNECYLFDSPGSIPMQLSRYISDRTGIISYANLSWMWIFAGRNNIFIWATGWQFSTFNLFHRHVARIATIQAIVHSIGYTAFFYIEDPTCKLVILNSPVNRFLYPLCVLMLYSTYFRGGF